MSLGLLALMVSGPFLLPFHTDPIPSFWNEWWAGAFGLAAAVIGLVARRNRSLPGVLPLPSLLLIPAILVMTLLLQFAAGRIVFPQVGLLYAGYLLWAGLLLVLGRYLADTIGLARLADVLAAALALGALIGALAALLQWLGVADRVPWIFVRQDGGIGGNLSQSNHHAHYSWLGIASAFYLRGRGYLPRWLLWLLILPISFGSGLGGSRSVFLYPLAVLAALALLRRREPTGPVAALIVDACLLLPALVLLNFFGAWAAPRIPDFWTWLGHLLPMFDLGGAGIKGAGSGMSGARLYESVSGPSERVAILRTGWAAFGEHPWLGQGAGNFPWASFVAAAGNVGDEPIRVAENAHNIVLQALAEFGAPATAAVIVLMLLWARRFFGRPWELEQFWCGAVLGIGAVHSLLEYPLWYAYFLGPTALLLGATSGTAASLTGRRVTVYLVLAALAGSSILTSLRLDYARIEAASMQPLAAHPDRERAWQISVDRLKVLHEESLLSPWVLLTFAILAEPSRQLADDRAALCERAIRFSPARALVTRCAVQLAIAGRDTDAQKLLQSIARAFPAERKATSDELTKAAGQFPEIAPLMHLSVGKQGGKSEARLQSLP